MDSKFFETLAALGTENSLDTEVMIETVKSAMQKSVQRMYPECKESIRVDIDPEKKIFDVFLLQHVVDDEPINHTEINIDEAKAIDPSTYVGAVLEHKLDISKFSRASAQSAKQSIKGDLRDINRDRILDKFLCKENDIITATVMQVEPGRGSATLMYDKTELYLLRQEQIPGEELKEGMQIKVYYEASLAQDPDFSYCLVNYGQWLYHAPAIAGGNKKKALECFYRASEMAKMPFEVYYANFLISQLELDNHNEQAYKETFEKAVSAREGNLYLDFVRKVNAGGYTIFYYIANREKVEKELNL